MPDPTNPHHLAVLAAGLSLLAFSPPASGEASRPEVKPLEEVDDSPGEPARPVPGAPPARVWRFGEHSAIQVNVDGNGANISGDAANEPSIAVDPTQPNHLAIGWRQFDTVASNFRQAGVAFSTDGGRTWTNQGVLDPGVFRSDPVLSFDAQGNFYYNSLEGDFTTDVFTSTDGGETWGPPVYAFGGDKQWMEVDRSGGPGAGTLYQAWSIAAGCCGNDMFNRAVAGPGSFDVPIQAPDLPRWGTMDVAPDGRLFVVGVPASSSTPLVVVSSGDAWLGGTPTFDRVSDVPIGGPLVLQPPPNPAGLGGQAWIAVDESDGPTGGFVYVLAAIDPPGGDPMDIHFTRSEDGGLSWSPPVRVNDDPFVGLHQWFGTMSVAPNGRIDVVWNDARNTMSTNTTQLFYAFSTDGGVTWSDNQPLSPIWNSHLGWPNQNKIGDYYDMVSDRVGAHLAWAATLNGEQDVFYTRIGDYDCNDNGVGDLTDIGLGGSTDTNGNGIPDECEGAVVAVGDTPAGFELLGARPNPFGATTTIRYRVTGRGGVVGLRIFDVSGREVRTLVDGFVPTGGYTVSWDGSDSAGNAVPQGVYYARLEEPSGVRTQRLLLVR